MDTTRAELQHLREFQWIVSDMYKYLKVDMNGCYQIAFLPYSGGLLEQPADWVENIEIILHCLNSK